MEITSIKFKNRKGEIIEMDFEDAKALYKELDSIFAEKFVAKTSPLTGWPGKYASPYASKLYDDQFKPTLFDSCGFI